MNKKILFVSCYFHMFNNIDCGASNRSTMFVKALAQIGDVDVISFAERPIESNIERCNVIFQKSIPDKTLKKRGYTQKITNLIKLLIHPQNPYTYYSLDKEKESIVRNLIENGNYDYVACRYINEAASCGLLNYSDKLILDVDDNLFSAAKRDLANKKFKSPIHKLIANSRARLLSVMSKSVLKNVKYSFYSNIAEPPYSKSVFLPNVTIRGVDIPALQDNVPKSLLIVGWLDFPPNKYGALYFSQNVFPLIRKQIPDIELRIAGKCKDSTFLNTLNNIPGVKALGYVSDISVEYKKCGVIIIPVYQGSGTSVKFTEGLTMNRPIVSTPMGARGFDNLCHSGKHYLLAPNDVAFSECVISLLKSVEKAKKIAESAHEIGVKYFSENTFINIVKSKILK